MKGSALFVCSRFCPVSLRFLLSEARVSLCDLRPPRADFGLVAALADRLPAPFPKLTFLGASPEPSARTWQRQQRDNDQHCHHDDRDQ
jgi:hypothetical protein